MAKVAFIGLGTMGIPMALNLIKNGHVLSVYDAVSAHVATLVAAGAHGAETAAQAVESCEFVITMLPNGQIVQAVVGPLLDKMQGPDAPIFVDCSTIAPQEAVVMAQQAARRGLSFIDAPVSGGVKGAEEASLAFMVGASPEDFQTVQPLLQAMARVVYHAGPQGSGQSVKICNNMLAAVVMAGTAEALALGESLGLDPGILSEIIGKSSGGSFLMDRWNPMPGLVADAPSSRGYANGFQLQLMLKDLGLALDAARAGGRSVPMGALAQNLYALHAQSGGPEAARQDFSKIIDIFRSTSSHANVVSKVNG